MFLVNLTHIIKQMCRKTLLRVRAVQNHIYLLIMVGTNKFFFFVISQLTKCQLRALPHIVAAVICQIKKKHPKVIQ